MVADAMPELAVAAGDESIVESPDRVEDGFSNGEAGGRYELVLCKVVARREAHDLVVPCPEALLAFRHVQLNFIPEVVGIGVFEFGGDALQPVLGNGHVRVDENDKVSVGVFDSSISGGVR